MKKKRFTEEQIVRMLRQAQAAEQTVAHVCKEYGVSEQTWYRWKSKFGVDFKKFSNLFFKFRNALNVKLFFWGSQFSSLSHLQWLLSGERGPPLDKKTDFSD
jgi:DNA-binding MurR/RpiR family transcriptional regulator